MPKRPYSRLSSIITDLPVFPVGIGDDSGGVVKVLAFFLDRSWPIRGVAVDSYYPFDEP